MILSLQGCMDVGKTTAVRYLQENAPYVNIIFRCFKLSIRKWIFAC